MLTGCADIGFRGWCDGPVAKWAGWVSGKGSKKVVLVFPSVCLARTGFDAMAWDERCDLLASQGCFVVSFLVFSFLSVLDWEAFEDMFSAMVRQSGCKASGRGDLLQAKQVV